MTGFEAIAQHNGWTMALIGALIVFSGLVILSLTISQLHRIIPLLEKKAPAPLPEKPRKTTEAIDKMEKPLLPLKFPMEPEEAAKLYEPIVKRLGENFSLTELYQSARNEGYPHPHLTISVLREAGILSAIGDGRFAWNRKSPD